LLVRLGTNTAEAIASWMPLGAATDSSVVTSERERKRRIGGYRIEGFVILAWH